ncbi:hypothetical protein N431DRAFT_170883 [Stipitochalara longipes BDJ]|nr:hypothetical protein N431DRAFT_170883 [Stipitochalara longipes BDJ]
MTTEEAQARGERQYIGSSPKRRPFFASSVTKPLGLRAYTLLAFPSTSSSSSSSTPTHASHYPRLQLRICLHRVPSIDRGRPGIQSELHAFCSIDSGASERGRPVETRRKHRRFGRSLVLFLNLSRLCHVNSRGNFQSSLTRLRLNELVHLPRGNGCRILREAHLKAVHQCHSVGATASPIVRQGRHSHQPYHRDSGTDFSPVTVAPHL